MKKTKIVTSIGPASANIKTFTEMVLAGANVARINFSHATIQERENVVSLVKEVRKNLGINIGILYDTKGPEFRSGEAKSEGINLVSGNKIRLVKENVIGDEEKFSVNYPQAIDSLSIGDIVLLENGLMKIEVISIEDDGVTCKIINGGILYSKKSLSVPGVKLDIPFISEIDREDIIYACNHEGNYLALSFVSTKEEVLEVREILKEQNREDLKLIAKIESQTGMDNLESIAEVSDGIMVARGDLGVEVPMVDLPICQKRIVNVCRKLNRICIVATEMLESMKHNPRPTRAEVTDIANAVYNGTDAVMLSGETTTGEYPVEAVKNMADICQHIESSITYKNIFAKPFVLTPTDAVIKGVAEIANSVDAKLIVVPTISGSSARLISNLEPKCPILALVATEEIAYSLAANYGVYTKVVNFYNDMDEIFASSLEEALEFIELNSGDHIIITGGFKVNKKDNEAIPTNLMKIETI